MNAAKLVYITIVWYNVGEFKEVEYMPVSDAKKRANRKYSDAHYEPLRLDVPKGYKAQIQAAATAAGQSVAAYVREAIARRMEQDEQAPKE